MKVKDLKKYKPMDITELSGSPWNTAEKVLGLDENDKVVMAEPDAVTYEEVEEAIDQAMATETARTESTYAKKGELPPLDDYYTKEETDAVVTSATQDMATKTWVGEQGYLTEHQDLSAYAKTTAVTQDIQTAIASETARTEDVYAKKSDVPDLDNYYTKSETDEAIEEAISGISLDGYWTSAETKNYVDTEIGADIEWTQQNFARKSEIPSLDGYATENYVDASVSAATATTTGWVESQGYLTEHQSLADYAKTTAVTADIEAAMAAETARTESTYLKEHQSLAGLFDSVQYVSSSKTINFYDKGENLVGVVDATDFIKDGMVDNVYISGSTLVISFNTDAGQEDITINLTDIFNPANYYDKTVIDGLLASETARTEGAYIKQTNLPYALTDFGGGASSLGQQWIQFLKQNTNTGNYTGTRIYYSKINGKDILGTDPNISGFAGNIELPTFSDVSTAITDSMETETARTESTYAKKTDVPSLDGYWTSAETQNAITAATDDMATETWVQNQGYLTQHQDISGKLDTSVFTAYTGATETVLEGKADISDIPDVSGFVTSGDVETQIGTAMATETARTESTYLKEHQDISGKLDVSVFTGYTGTTETALDGQVDLATYTAYTGSTATAIAGKQDTLVSGTNIKTINNQSLLGSGNIDIQGGGGGGDNVVELTKAQYEALNPPAADTTYIITDADVVDLNDYAPASGLTELSGTVETISSNYATKQNVTARASSNTNPYLPGWNSQGVITGASQVYSVGMSINGSNQNGLLRSSNTNLTGFYAPTSAGTAGQPLLSNGSGAPVWGGYKFAFLTQTAYDALATKDSTTIYFITGD